jgi:hypothetical protein
VTPSLDSHLRDLERRLLQSGSPDDEAAYLLERVRVGDLAQQRLELAAHCGHPGARLAFGQHAPDDPQNPERLIELLCALGTEACVRASMALCRRGLQAWRAQPPFDSAPRDLLDACEGWLRDRESVVPQVRSADEAVTEALVDWTQADDARWNLQDERQVPVLAVNILKRAAFFVLRDDDTHLATNVRHMLELASSASGLSLSQAQRGMFPTRAGAAAWSTALLALAEELIPWALGKPAARP